MKKPMTDDEIAAAGRELLQREVDSQDAATRSRLNQVRQKALAELAAPGRPAWLGHLPLAGASAAAVLAVAFVMLRPDAPEGVPLPVALNPQSLDDVELLLAEDSLEMLEELEFYELLDVLAEADVGSTTIG